MLQIEVLSPDISVKSYPQKMNFITKTKLIHSLVGNHCSLKLAYYLWNLLQIS
jgi:hypothetical protein